METNEIINGPSEIKIFSTTGRQIKTISNIFIGTQKLPIDVSSLQNGLYYLKIQNQFMESISTRINILH